ncbi:head GIN domain-containing protein [Pyxidicoccus caerfyrddinensis]|uniref:head GIN domain-containing protein n=1 Tax=Pyxidicoccus caerfyrddinensis TaxID=2709663 RepID=UPI0013DD42F0|nr:head GIN domain-containing protein [Pyxidicoccus caerfyrddinensis]
MKTARISFLVSFLALAACAHAQEAQKNDASAQKGESRDVPDFHSVAVSHGIQAEVKVGPKSVRLEGPSDLVARVKLKVEDGTLVTEVERDGLFSNFRGGKVHLYVTSPKVLAVGASGGSHVEAEATETDEFTAEASGGAVLTVRGVDARKVDAEASGGSRVKLSGRAQEMDAEASGGAEVLAFDVKGLKELEAEASGGSRVEADVSERVSGDASGGSTIRLVSRPNKSDVDTSGGSRVTYKD